MYVVEFKSKVGKSDLYGDIDDRAEQRRMKQRRIIERKSILDEDKSIPEPLQYPVSRETADMYGASRQLGVSTWQDNEEDEDDAESIECDCAVPDKTEPNYCSSCNGWHSME